MLRSLVTARGRQVCDWIPPGAKLEWTATRRIRIYPTDNKITNEPTMKSTSSLPTVIICPGNGCTNIRRSNWYGDLFHLLQQRQIPAICEDFPDPHRARRDIWIPHVRRLASRCDEIILVGHSSGAQAALRYAEQYPCRAAVLVAATFSDLGDANERASGYYPQGGSENSYDFEAMKSNCPIWYQFHSDNDPFIPLAEAEQIRDGLGLSDTYQVLRDHSHFFEPFPELLDVLEKIVYDS